MNTMNHDPRNPDPIDEREWQAQERALQAERHGVDASDDPLVARYRVLARALRQPLADAPPADFAAAVARQVAPRLAADDATDSALERVLTQGLIAALGLSGGVVAVLYGRDWLVSITDALPSGAGGQWALAIALCMGASWALEQWRRQRARNHGP